MFLVYFEENKIAQIENNTDLKNPVTNWSNIEVHCDITNKFHDHISFINHLIILFGWVVFVLHRRSVVVRKTTCNLTYITGWGQSFSSSSRGMLFGSVETRRPKVVLGNHWFKWKVAWVDFVDAYLPQRSSSSGRIARSTSGSRMIAVLKKKIFIKSHCFILVIFERATIHKLLICQQRNKRFLWLVT